jgi:hypothetical protein
MATSVSKLIIRLQKFSSKISKSIDATNSFNSLGYYYQDLSGWDSAVVQFVNPSEAISFFTTNDNGEITGQLLPAPEVPLNWSVVKGVDLATKGDVVSSSTDSIVEFGIIGQYLLLQGATTNDPSSYGYLLSAPVANIQEAYNTGIQNGARLVYAATNSQNSVTEFFGDSRLTIPVYGNGTYWYGYRLLSAPSNGISACTISPLGVVSID